MGGVSLLLGLEQKLSRLLEASRELQTRHWEVSPQARGLPSRGRAGGRFEVGVWEAKLPCSCLPTPSALSRVLCGLTLEGLAYPAVVLGPRGEILDRNEKNIILVPLSCQRGVWAPYR